MVIPLTAIENMAREKIWQGSGVEGGIGGFELISLVWDNFQQTGMSYTHLCKSELRIYNI